MDQFRLERISSDLFSLAWENTTKDFNDNTFKFKIGNSTTERLNSRQGVYNERTQSYEQHLTTNPRQKKGDLIYNAKLINNHIKCICSYLNCIPMSQDNVKDHIDTYIIDDEEDSELNLNDILKSNYPEFINLSRDRIYDIFFFWLLRAQTLAKFKNINKKIQETYEPEIIDLISSQDPIELSRFVLRGKPGIGKTALINYLFSDREQCLRNNSIIWIRVDLNTANDFRHDLKSQFYAKFLSTFTKNYLFLKEFPFDDRFLENFKTNLTIDLEESFSIKEDDISNANAAENYIKLLRTLSTRYKLKKNDEIQEVSSTSTYYPEHKVNNLLVNHSTEFLMHYIQKEFNYGFMIIFDGLDSVTIDFAQVTQFMSWMKILDDLTSNKKRRYNAVYIITMRDYSFIELYRKIHQENIMLDVKDFSVLPQKLGSIMIARFDYFSKKLRTHELSISFKEIRNLFINILEILFKVLGINFESSDERDVQYVQKIFTKFKEINNDNFRAALRVFRDLLCVIDSILNYNSFELMRHELIDQYTEKKILRKNWEIIRTLLFGDSNQLLYKNRVMFKQSGESPSVDIRDPSLIFISSRSRAMIPNIFNFRDFMYKSETYFPKNLCKLRMIKFLTDQPGQKAGINELIGFYQNNFEYKEEDLRFETREMIYNGVISPELTEIETFVLAMNGNNYMVSLTGLGEIIHDIIITDSIYYEIVCDDTPIQREFSHFMGPYSRYDGDLRTSQYLINKTKQIILFYLYLLRVEKEERIRFLRVNRNNRSLYKKYAIFFDTKIEEKLKDSIQSYIAGYLSTLNPDDSSIYSFAETWINYYKFSNQIVDYSWRSEII